MFIDLSKQAGIDSKKGCKIISNKNGNLIICRSDNSMVKNTQELKDLYSALNKSTLEINGKKVGTIIDNILKHTVESKIDDISIGHITEKPTAGLPPRI